LKKCEQFFEWNESFSIPVDSKSKEVLFKIRDADGSFVHSNFKETISVPFSQFQEKAFDGQVGCHGLKVKLRLIP
jgi:hypothetical protein